MTVDTTTSAVPPTEPTALADRGRSVRFMAFGLWAVVATILGYGILQTAIKASALF